MSTTAPTQREIDKFSEPHPFEGKVFMNIETEDNGCRYTIARGPHLKFFAMVVIPSRDVSDAYVFQQLYEFNKSADLTKYKIVAESLRDFFSQEQAK